jgi:GTP-binding protein YchF
MVRIFAIEDETSTEQTHVYGSIDPLRDIKVINMELILADMESVQKRREKIARDVKRGDKEAIAEDELCKKILKTLEEEKLANSISLNDDEKKIIKSLHLLTMKPVIYGLNKKTGGRNLDETDLDAFKKVVADIESAGSQYVLIDAKTEFDLSEFDGEEKQMMREDIGHDDGIDELIQKSYTLLGLMTYFKTGDKETRAWTVKQGSTAPQAGVAIHSDFETQFIRANIIGWKELLDAGSFAEARAQGKLRTEGKEYIVQDGDVIEFLV